jgi:hypothetical protein
MKKRGIKPNKITYIALFSNLRNASTEEFQKIASPLIEALIENDDITVEIMDAYLQAFDRYSSKGLQSEFEFRFNDLIRQQLVEPDQQTFTILINNHIAVLRHGEKLDDANTTQLKALAWRSCLAFYASAIKIKAPDDYLVCAILAASAYASKAEAMKQLFVILKRDFNITRFLGTQEWTVNVPSRDLCAPVLAAMLQVAYRCGEVPLALFCWNTAAAPDYQNGERLIRLCKRYKRKDWIPFIESQISTLKV